MPPRRPSFLDDADNQSPRFVPKTGFVGREDILSRFTELLSAPQAPDEYRIFNIYGIGGQGKTSLAQQFAKRMEKARETQGKHIAWAALNFETEAYRRDPALALLSIRHQLRRQGITFPAFDTAFGRYFALTQQGRDIEAAHPELFYQELGWVSDLEAAGGDILKTIGGTVGDLIGDIPGVGSITKNAGKLSSKLTRWWQRRGNRLLQGLDLLEPHQITERLPVYLAADLYEWLSARDDAQPRRLTLILDTYEALWRERASKVGSTAIRVDEWVQTLANDAAGTFMVVLGREALTWQQQDQEWETCIHPWKLDELEPDAAEKLLQQVPIPEADIRAVMLRSSERVAFYLKLHIDHYAELKNQGREPVVADFAQAQGQIIARFTDHMEAGFRQALKVCSCPRFLDEALFLKLAQDFLGGSAAVSFHDLRHYSFWEEPEQGEQSVRYRLHNVMREQLQALLQREEPALLQQIHQYLFDLYDEVFARVAEIDQTLMKENKIERIHDDFGRYQELLKPYEAELQHLHGQFDDALREGLYHLEQVDPKRLPFWLDGRDDTHGELADWSLLQPLWEYVLQLVERVGGADHPDTALSLNNLAELYLAQGKYSAAEPLFERALHIIEAQLGADHHLTATSLNNLAVLYYTQCEYSKAEPLYERALHICEAQLGADHPDTASSLNNLAELYRSLGKYSKAEPLYERALDIRETQLGRDHPDTASSLNNLAAFYQSQGKYSKAEPLYQRALRIREDRLGVDHPDTAISLGNLASLYYDRGKYSEAEPLYQRALYIHETQLGENHPDTSTSLNNLANLYRFQGKYSKAEPLYQRALRICEDRLGVDHPTTNITKDNLRRLRQKIDTNAWVSQVGKQDRLGRNSPCHCGSGKRYKHCHGRS